jgi:ABC-type antimicrobial peptide transport system permease subunit
VAYYITQSFNSDFFTMQFHVSVLSYVLVSAGVLLTVVLSVIPAIRRANRMNLAEATKVLT